MKKVLTVFSLVLLLMCLGSSARAVTWSFDFESLNGSMDTWGPEPPVVETEAIEYDYQWELTDAQLRIEHETLPGGVEWIPILNILQPEDKFGSGTEGPLPFILSPIHIDAPGITADMRLGVLKGGLLTDGQATGILNNITFGTIGSDPVYDVTGVRIWGDFTVTPVPEPVSIALLSLGVLTVLTKRRARKI
jgi:hypothetical protein